MAMMMNFYFTLTVVQGQAPPPPPPPPPAAGDRWDGCSTLADVEKNIERCMSDPAYFSAPHGFCIKTCREFRAARQAPAADGAACNQDYQCASNMCHNKQCKPSWVDENKFCRYLTTPYGPCEKGGKNICTKGRTVLKTNYVESGKNCFLVNSELKSACNCENRLDNNAPCTESAQCKSEICHSGKCVESTKEGFCRYHLGKAGQCQRVHKNSTSTCERQRVVMAAGSSNIAESNKAGGCYVAGNNFPQTCSCGARLDNNAPCTESAQCKSDICHSGKCVESFKHEGCAFSFGEWGECKLEAQNKCKQRRQVKEFGFITQQNCSSSLIADKLEKECACQDTGSPQTSTCTEHIDPKSGNKYIVIKKANGESESKWSEEGCKATNTTTANDECTEHTTKDGKKYYYKASAKSDVKTAWTKAECEALV